MYVRTDCSWLDERTDLNNVVGTSVGTITINQQPCSYMIEHIVRKGWNNKIEQRCYNNHEFGCCIKSGFACSNISEQPLSIRQAVYNMIEQYTVILPTLSYHANSVVTGLLSQQPCDSLWYFYACRFRLRFCVFFIFTTEIVQYFQSRFGKLWTEECLVVLDVASSLFRTSNNSWTMMYWCGWQQACLRKYAHNQCSSMLHTPSAADLHFLRYSKHRHGIDFLSVFLMN